MNAPTAALMPLAQPGAELYGLEQTSGGLVIFGGGIPLTVDGVVVGEGEIKRTVWSRFSLTGAGLTAGWSLDFSPADEDYRGRFAFTATLHHVDIDVPGDPVVDPEAEAEAIIASQ